MYNNHRMQIQYKLHQNEANMENFMWYVRSRLTVTGVIEIVIIAIVIYKLIDWLRGTQAARVFKGLMVLLFLGPATQWLGFRTINYIITSMLTWAFMLFVIVFQPELRSALERIGNTRYFRHWVTQINEDAISRHIRSITSAAVRMSEERVGALIVIQRENSLKNIKETGIALNAEISQELIENIFTPNRPLHDGALIVDLNAEKLVAAACLLPLSNDHTLGNEFGTRHRAGIGMSENSDAFTIIVSEETGIISFTEKGMMLRGLTKEDLGNVLENRFVPDKENDINHVFWKFWKNKKNNDELPS